MVTLISLTPCRFIPLYSPVKQSYCCWCSVIKSESLLPNGLQSTMLLCPSLSPLICSTSRPPSQWFCLTISSSSHPLPPLLLLPSIFPTSGSFPSSQLFTSSGQSFGTSASTSVLPVNIQSWFPLGLTGLISLLSEELSRVFSSTIQKHRFFGVQPSLWSSSHIHTWLLEKP